MDADITLKWELGATFTTFKADILEVSKDADEVFVGGNSLAGVYAVKYEGFVIKGTAYQRDGQGRIIINPDTGNPLYTTTLKTLVCLANLRSVETYINYLKTGYPETPLAIGAQEANKPYRLIYPISEYTSNSGNVPNMSNSDAFTKNKFTPFWNRD